MDSETIDEEIYVATRKATCDVLDKCSDSGVRMTMYWAPELGGSAGELHFRDVEGALNQTFRKRLAGLSD